MPITATAARHELTIPSRPDHCCRVQEQVIEQMRSAGFGNRHAFAVRLALEEAFVNAMKHGNAGDSSKKIRVAVEMCEDEVCIEVEDQGEGFCPEAVPDPTLPQNIGRPSGRGLLLMRTFMSSVEYSERGNRVTMTLRR